MHLTVRMAWHDNNWNGKVCQDPEGNSYCSGAHSLLSGRIEKHKQTDREAEDGIRDEYVEKNFTPTEVPPCYWSINAFSDRGFRVEHKHAFKGVKHTVPDNVKPYSVFTWPFKLSFVHSEEKKAMNGNYWPDLEKRISDFTGKFKKGESIIFFYANYDNPVSADEMKYLLLGCSVINEVEMPGHYKFSEAELNRFGKGKKGSPMKNFPTLNWAIQFTHLPEKAILLPYKEYIAHVEQYPEEFEKLQEMRVVIDEPSLVRSFKYVAMDIDDDKCLFLLYKIRKSLLKIKDHNQQVVAADMDAQISKVEGLIKGVWERRGIYPSLEKVFEYFLKRDCTAFSAAIRSLCTSTYDLMQVFDDLRSDKIPPALEEYFDEIDDLKRVPQFGRDYKAYLKLTLFNLTSYQIENIIENYYESIVRGLDENPYLLFENYIPEPPADELDTPDLVEETIDVFKVDIGMIPDSRFVRRHRQMQNIGESSPQRIRSLVVEYLMSLEGPGHTYDNLRNIIANIKEYPLIFHSSSGLDEQGIQALVEPYRSHFAIRFHITEIGSEKYLYLLELYLAEQRIKEKVELLLNRTNHKDKGINVATHIAESVDALCKRIKDFDADTFTTERSKLYENIFSKSLFLLTGKPGSGKTFETSHIIKHLQGLNQGLEILAPTGKAALRLSENIRKNTGLAIKANTIDRFIFDNGFWWAYEDWDRLQELPEQEKMTVTNLIIDESSMLDLQKLYILFSIIKLNNEYPKRLIFVGDENQLPPIGFGKPFHDIISHVMSKQGLYDKHYIHLSTNCRQENDLNILKLAEAFSDKTRYYEESLNLLEREGKISDGLEIYYWKSKKELQERMRARIEGFVEDDLRQREEGCLARIEMEEERKNNKDERYSGDEFLGHLENRAEHLENGLSEEDQIVRFNLMMGLYNNGYVPGGNKNFRRFVDLENFQILSPYRPGFFGTVGLNSLVQEHFRDTSFKDDSQFYHADKLIRISNYYSGYGRQKKMILSNGSIGVVTNHAGNVRKYFFKDADFVLEWIDDEEEFELAYAITVHKSQGSDFNTVFLVVPNKLNLLNKELIYTALTRSKKRMCLFIYNDDDNLLDRAKGISALLTRNSSIFAAPEEKKWKYYPRKGDKPVRSKGEYIIHTALQKSGLKFDYEKELKLENRHYLIHPDFTITLDDGSTIFWEHLGMLDTRKYYNDWVQRKKDYTEHGLFQYVVTTDDLEGIDEGIVETVIENIRTKKLSGVQGVFSDHHYRLYPNQR